MTGINLAIIGAGLVGSAFIRQLQALSKKHVGLFNVIYIGRSTKTLISNDYSPIDLDQWEPRFNSSQTGVLPIEEIISFLGRSPKPVVLVDNTSNGDLASAYPLFLKKAISIATPNKKAFSSSLVLWNEIASTAVQNNALVYHEATVGAGLPIIGTLNDLVNTGDKIKKIEGIVSGTLSYIFNEFSTVAGSTVKFSDVVKKAKQLGYTEPDPREDLNGLDVARKVTILARLSGYDVHNATCFPVQSLIPKQLEGIESADEFLEKLPDYDDELDVLRKQAETEGKVLRFVGKIDLSEDPKTVKVGIEKYSKSHPFASLSGSDNVVSFLTERYSNPLVIQGAGAGAEVTAAGVLADVIRISQIKGN